MQFGSDDLEGDASNIQFGLDHLLPRPLEEDDSPGRFNLDHLLPQRLEEDPSPSQFNLEYLIPSRLPNNLETPTKGHLNSDVTPRSNGFHPRDPTEQWVRQFLEGRWNRERSAWLSDYSSESDLGRNSRNNSELEVPKETRKKKTRKSNKTLNQQDFWSHFSKGQKEELGKMMASRYAPEAPKRQASNGSLRAANEQSAEPKHQPEQSQPAAASEAPKPPQAPPSKLLQVPASPTLTPRPRKKVIVKGKGCIISIPRDIPRGTPGFPPKPMSPAAVEAKMQEFERAGYSVKGDGTELPSQNRAIWPDDEYIRTDRSSDWRVRVPNKAEWDAYEAYLVEAKLAALGVELGGGDEAGPSPMSRQGSVPNPNNPFSPPLPTSSAGSHRVRQGSIVSGPFPLGPSPGHVSRQSMVSPMSVMSNPRQSMHMHRHSTFASPASFAQQTASPTGRFSPGNYFSPQGTRGGSPALPFSRPDLTDGTSPISPFGMRPNQSFPPTPTPKDDMFVQMQQQQQQLQAQLLLQQQQQLLSLRPSSTLAEVPEDEAEEEEVPAMKHATQPGPDIAVPTPRGHRHNISANLEREARDGEYHLEQAINKQFEEGGDFSTEPEITPEQLKPSDPIANSNWEGSRTVLHQPQPHNRAHSLAQSSNPINFGFSSQQENPRSNSEGAKSNVSEATNPSLEGQGSARHSKPASISNSWKEAKIAFGKPESAMHSKHTSKSSTSKLNVEAKEFKFNPGASFSPPSMASSFSSFVPPVQPETKVPPRSNAGSLTSLNVSAPVFKPDAPVFKPDAPVFQPVAAAFKPDVPAFKPTVPEFKPSVPEFKPQAPVFKPDVPAFKPAAAPLPAMPTSGFNFFSAGPSFKPDAPAFQPGSTELKPTVPAAESTTISSKIFGDVNIAGSDIIKPAKRSKAIPIVRPDLSQSPKHTKKEEFKDDAEGRTAQADGREKRARRGRSDADDVPKFAIQPVLASTPLGESKRQQKQDPQLERETLPEDKENMSPKRPASKSKTPEALMLDNKNVPAIEASLPTPQTDESAETVSTPRTRIDDRTPHESDAHESDVCTPRGEEASKSIGAKHGHKSSLSATAKPFEFRPAGYDFGIHVTKPSVAQEEDLNTHFSPQRFANQSPASAFRPSDDGSYRTALETRRHVAYTESEMDFDQFGQASFNDIDAVMKHMDDNGSDFGVERDGPSNWGRSTMRVSPHNFDRSDLRPTNNLMRSDAPSPSPRRLYAANNLGASASSLTQNPFDTERAGHSYDSPVHRLNNADEVSLENWDADIPSEEEDKVQARSGFFDSHVDELLSRLLQSRLGPLESNLRDIQDSLAMMSRRGRRSMSTNERLESDADDEDDESVAYYRNRSPKKDRKLEKLRSIVKEALESHQASSNSTQMADLEHGLPDKIRDIVVDALAAHQPPAPPAAAPSAVQPENVRDIIMEALAHHQPQWTPPKFEPVPADQIRTIIEEAIVSHQPTDSVKPDDLRSIVAEVVTANIPQPTPAVEPIKPEDIRSIVVESLAAHAPQPTPAPVQEQILPEHIRSIVTEALESRIPAAEPIQPETIRSIVAEALQTHQPQLHAKPIPEIVQPDEIRAIVAEALASHKPRALEAPIDIPQPQVDLSEIYQVIGSLKASIAQTTSNHLQVEDIRDLLDEAFKRQGMEEASREESQAIQEKDARIAELEALLQEASLRLDDEMEVRKDIQKREADTARLLKVTEEELALFKESTRDDENKIRALEEEVEVERRSLALVSADDQALRSKLADLENENEQLKLKGIAFESSEEDMKKRLDVATAESDEVKKRMDAVTAENEALTFTLNEHRLSANKWRDDIQKANMENEKLRKAIEQSRFQAEEATRLRESMRAKFEKLQQDMVVASGQAAAERAEWQKSDETHMKKYEVLSARIEAEGRTRERLERELERLETQEREAMKLRIALEQMQKQNARLEDTVDQLKQETLEHQRTAERYEREYRDARETAHSEIRRTRVLLEADIEAANHQVNIIRADLEAEVSRARAELDNVRMEADTTKAKHELELDAASDAKKAAVDEVMQKSKQALIEQEHAFERRLEHLAKENSRALDQSREDKDRAEAYFNDRLSIADSKLALVQEKVALLEEKLTIAKEAASAAAAAAQSAKSPSGANGPTAYASGSEKISPQALRESIAVLQEQLQERESRIESLEQQLAEIDTDAPNKLKERDTEIGWLRELLGVRIDDLNDLINALAQPSFNRESVRDAAIRIRTNLQMEQSEKERLMTGGQNFPTLATLSNFASPKAVQLAAAFGNWRKGRENASSALAGGSKSNSSTNSSRNQTPSRAGPPSAQSFLSGLMTPPKSNMRRTPEPRSTSATRPLSIRTNSASSRDSVEAGFPSLGKQPVPSTPPLLRGAAYDQDAEDGHFSESGFYDDESTVDGDVTPIGLNFGSELRRAANAERVMEE